MQTIEIVEVRVHSEAKLVLDWLHMPPRCLKTYKPIALVNSRKNFVKELVFIFLEIPTPLILDHVSVLLELFVPRSVLEWSHLTTSFVDFVTRQTEDAPGVSRPGLFALYKPDPDERQVQTV